MPFIELDLGSAKETVAVPEGEYDLRVASFDLTKSQKGNDMYKALILVESSEYPNAQPITEYLTLPSKNHDEKARNFLALQIKRFLSVFGIPFEAGGFNDEDVNGATGRCMVVQDEPDENGNIWNKLRMPRLKNEDDDAPEQPATRRPQRRRA